MNKQFLIRTAAVIYADNYSSRKTDTIKKKFIEAIFCNNGNNPLTIGEIGNKLSDDMKLSFTDNEIEKIVMDKDNFLFQQFGDKTNDKYSLEKKRFDFLSRKSKDNLDECIERYLHVEKDNMYNDIISLKELLQKYLYYIMNSNIEAFNLVLTGGSTIQNINSGITDLSEEEIVQINNFLSWKDSTKDKELFKMVSFCIEYAIVVNNSNESNLIRSIKNKILYIDNAFIYRALGINGEVRRKRTISFIKKCLETGQKLRISKFSREEFIKSIDYHIRQLANTTPFGRINFKLFSQYSNGDSIYQYYHQWRGNRISYGFDIFKSSIISEYNNLIRTYNIEEDYVIPFDDKNDIPEISKYSEEIENIKRKGNKESHNTDAKNMYWIEKKRNGCDGRLTDTKYYFITPDQKLQQWDYNHSSNQPITLLPSQWLALILKYTSRTNDDYQSFVSFLKIPNKTIDITPEDLQEIVAGISEVTEDLQKQGNILDVYIEEEWRKNHSINNSINLRENIIEFAKNKQEEYFAQEIEKKTQEMVTALNEQKQLNDDQIKSLEENYKQQIRIIEENTKKEILSLKIDNLNRERLDLQDCLQKKINEKELIDSILHRNKKIIIAIISTIYIIILSVWIYLIYKVGWNKMEMFTYIIATILAIPNFLYKINYVNKFSFKHVLDYILKKKKESLYVKYEFEDTIIDKINRDINEINTRISWLKKNF